MRFFKKATPLILFLADLVTIILSIFLAYKSREWFIGPNDMDLGKYLHLYLFYIPLFLFLFNGLYRYRYDFWHESKLIGKSLLLSLLIVLSFLALTRNIADYSRYIIVISFVLMAFLIPLQKRLLKRALFFLGLWKKEAKFVGNDQRMQEILFRNYYMGYVPSNERYETLFINARELPEGAIEDVLKKEILSHHELLFIPLIQDFNLSDSVIFELLNSRSNLIFLRNRLQSRYNLFLKALSDRVLGGFFFLLFIPAFFVISIVIFLHDPRSPILFRQERIGKHGRKFTLFKFRTMYPDADCRLQEYLKQNPQAANEYRLYKKLKNDPRVTPIGRVLRKYSLDELPQLINVVRGEMSIIGPRPYLAEELQELGDYAPIIFSVKPGITGLWQVSGRNRLTFEERIHIDLWYVYNWSLWKDMVILLKTFRALLSKEGAY